MERYRLEWSTPGAESCNQIGQNNAAGMLVGSGRDFLCQDCNRGGPVVRTQAALDFTIAGIARWGSTGAFDSENTDGLRVEDLLQVGGGGSLPSRVDGFVVALESGAAALAGLQHREIRSGLVRDTSVTGKAVISTLDDGVLENVALFDVDTTRACAGECGVLRFVGTPALGMSVRDVSVAVSPGGATSFDQGAEAAPTGPGFTVDGLLVSGMSRSTGLGRGIAGAAAQTSSLFAATSFGPLLHDNRVDAQSPASLPPSAVRGVAPGFVDAAARRFDTAAGSAADLAGSGIRRGVEAPGAKRYRWIHAITRTVPEALADDPDGDGVRADPEVSACQGGGTQGCSDNCPALFNPDQADTDGNAQGDACQGPCRDGLDNDGDGLADFPADPGCRDALAPLENPQCQDGLNNDPGQDARIDWDGGASAGLPPAQQTAPDPQCAGRPWRNLEGKVGCGLGFELVLLLPLLALRRARGATAPRRAGTPSRCARRGRARCARPRR